MDRPRRRRRTGPWLAAALALVALALGAYVLLRRPPLITLPAPPGPAAVPEPTPSPSAPPLDGQRTVEVYRRLQPLCEDAYRGLGKPQGRFDDVLVKAIRTLLAAPVVEGDVELTPKVITYAFADPALEGLTPAQKHLLRMGPKNVHAIQAELRALATALGMG